MSHDTHTLDVDVAGMSCGGCESRVRAAVSALPQVETVDVSAARGKLVVTSTTDVAAEVLDAVEAAGYRATRS